MNNKTLIINEKELKDLIHKEARKVIISMIKAQEILVETRLHTRTHRLSYDVDVVTSVDSSKGILILNEYK